MIEQKESEPKIASTNPEGSPEQLEASIRLLDSEYASWNELTQFAS